MPFYIATIVYTDTTGIKAMWKYHQFIICPEHFKTEEEAQAVIEKIKAYWLTPKMKQKIRFESSSISKGRE